MNPGVSINRVRRALGKRGLANAAAVFVLQLAKAVECGLVTHERNGVSRSIRLINKSNKSVEVVRPDCVQIGVRRVTANVKAAESTYRTPASRNQLREKSGDVQAITRGVG